MEGFIYLMLFWFVGEIIVRYLHVPLPGQIVGMALLLISLLSGLVRVEDVKAAADFLLKHMMLLFVPVVVGVVAYSSAFINEPMPIMAAIVLGTLGVLAAVGGTASVARLRKRKERNAVHDITP